MNSSLVRRQECFFRYLRERGLDEDSNFHILAAYYSTLKDGGDGEMVVKLLRGKLTVKGATYLRKIVHPAETP